MTQIELQRPSNPLDLYRRILLTSRPGLQGDSSIPRIEVRSNKQSISASNLARYRDVCGFSLSDRLPITYPYTLAFKLHMEAMSHHSFPLAMLGLVHVRNIIEELRPLNAQMSLDYLVWTEGHRPVDAGIELDVNTEIRSGGTLVWRAVSTYIKRSGGSSSGKKTKPAPLAPLGDNLHIENWKLPEGLGRKYAAVSGDNNPIHLHALTAKALGFPRHIAHGMWTKARAVGALQEQLPDAPCRVSAQFKLPLYLPGKVQFQALKEADNTRFEVRDSSGTKPHLAGLIEAL